MIQSWLSDFQRDHCPAAGKKGAQLGVNRARQKHMKEIVSMKEMEIVPIKQTVSYDVFEKIDIRVGTISRVEDIKGADKLVRLIVDFGDHQRRILAGIKQERESPREIEGKQALFLVNLEPKKMMGEVSEGMLLDIGYADGIKPVLAVPEITVPNGTRAG
jgi:tRNA-binding protein